MTEPTKPKGCSHGWPVTRASCRDCTEEDLRAEIERLRALLTEVYNHGENADLHRRIGEALGAGPGEDAQQVSASGDANG